MASDQGDDLSVPVDRLIEAWTGLHELSVGEGDFS